MRSVRVPVVRHEQKGVPVYVGTFTADIVSFFTFADHYPPTPGRLGYQRPPDPRRAQAFATYLDKDPAGFMTPVLLNARKPLCYEASHVDPAVGFLVLSPESEAVIVDGQHRILGMLRHLADPTHPLPFMLFDHLDTDTEQELFITINREQKRVSMSHVHFVSRGSDPLAELVSRLESDPESPWFRRVNLIGAKGTKRPVSLQSLRSALEALLQAGEVKCLTAEEQYQITCDYWRTIASVWPAYWSAPRASLLTKSIGTLAVAKLGGYILPRCLVRNNDRVVLDVQKVRGLFVRASDVDWSSDGFFRGYAGRHGADLIKTHLDGLIFAKGAAATGE